jgi:DNA-binding XRE family transcriptional regulator
MTRWYQSSWRRPKPGFVYLIERRGCHKIGHSADPARRLKDFDKPPGTASLIHAIAANHPWFVERAMQKAFWHFHEKDEWYVLPVEAVALFRSVERCDGPADLPAWASELVRKNILSSNRASTRAHGRPARKRMTAARFLAGLTLAGLADATGLSEMTLGAIEAANHHPPPARWERIAAVLGESAETLSEILP